MKYAFLPTAVTARSLAAKPPTGDMINMRPFELGNLFFESFNFGPSIQQINTQMQPTDESYVHYIKWCNDGYSTEAVEVRLFNPNT